jgi:hypothetical protein
MHFYSSLPEKKKVKRKTNKLTIGESPCHTSWGESSRRCYEPCCFLMRKKEKELTVQMVCVVESIFLIPDLQKRDLDLVLLL